MKNKYRNIIRALIVISLAAAVGVVIYAKNVSRNNAQSQKPTDETPAPQDHKTVSALPRLIDLGADKCIPCKMMKPILEELEKEYSDQFEVVFIDVWQNEAAGKAYRVNIIPTQIFIDASGKELFRHEGFFSKEDILAKWNELGIEVKGKIPEQEK